MPVKLWAARLDRTLTEEECTRLMALLPSQRRERLVRMKDMEQRREPLCAYWLLLTALRQEFGWEHLPEIARTPAGKPYFPAYPDIHFNMSHTDGAVLIGLGDVPVGVDIERIHPVSARMLERAGQGIAPEAFFKYWVRQEARAKCGGSGIAAFLHGEPPLAPEEHYEPLDLFPGYAAGVACCGTAEVVKIQKLLWSRDVRTEG